MGVGIALARWVTTRPRHALALVAVATLVMGVGARDVGFHAGADTAEFGRRIGTTSRNDHLLVAAIETATPTEESFRFIERVSDRVAAMPGVVRVDSVTTVDVLRRTPDGLGSRLGPAFGADTTGEPVEQRIALARDSGLGSAHLISSDGRVALVIGVLDDSYDSYDEIAGPAARFERSLAALVAAAPAPDGTRAHVAGTALTTVAVVDQVGRSLRALVPLAAAMMIMLLWWFFRRPEAVGAVMAAAVASTVWTAGLIGLAGDDLDHVTILYPLLVAGSVVATSSHLTHRYYLERARRALTPRPARLALERIAPAAIVCSVANAVGFLSLLATDLTILNTFGVYLAAAVGFSLASSMLVVPAVLVLRTSRPPEKYLQQFTAEQSVAGLVVHQPSATRVFGRIVTNPTVAVAAQFVGVAVVIASVAIATDAHLDSSMSAELDSDRSPAVGNRLIDRRLAGILPIDIEVRGAPGAFADPGTAERLVEFHDWLASDVKLRTVGLPSLMGAVEELGIPSPTDTAGYETLYSILRTMGSSDPLRRMVTDDLAAARLRGFHPTPGRRPSSNSPTGSSGPATRCSTSTGSRCG